MARTSARKIALARGEAFYFSPKPCVGGHTTARKTSDGHCLECNAIRERGRPSRHKPKSHAAKPETARQRSQRLGLKHYCSGRPCRRGHVGLRDTGNHACVRCLREDYKTNRAAVLANRKAHYEANREVVRAKQNAYHRSNPPSRLKARAAYEQRLRSRTPKWLNDEHWQKISDFYSACPDGHHVDHVIPLHGKTVCGLHVPWNLQYLTAKANLTKRNSFSETATL